MGGIIKKAFRPHQPSFLPSISYDYDISPTSRSTSTRSTRDLRDLGAEYTTVLGVGKILSDLLPVDDVPPRLRVRVRKVGLGILG